MPKLKLLPNAEFPKHRRRDAISVKIKRLGSTVDPSGSQSGRTAQTHRPVKLGGVVQFRSNWSNARVHSATHAVASFSTPAAVGVRPPHMAGLTASCRAWVGISPLLDHNRQFGFTPRFALYPSSTNQMTCVHGRINSLFADFGKNQPTIIPAASASRIIDYLPLGCIQALGAERIILCQCT